MNSVAISHDDTLADLPDGQLPGRPRHRLLNRVTIPLLALLVGAAGFLVGIEVEKGHGTAGGGSSTAGHVGVAGGRSGFSGFPGAGARSGTRSSARSGSSSFTPPSGGFGGAAAGGGATTGTISSISGDTIALKTTSGNTVTVTLTSATSLKKDLVVTRNSIRPGDEITVTGISGSGGSVKAASISDSGHASSSSAG